MLKRRSGPPPAFYPSLESFRGIAAVSVVLYHLGFVNGDRLAFLQGAGIFVDFFFLLSGFVMSHAYLGRIRDGLGFWPYLRARLARLYPLHLFLLLVWVPYILVKLYVYTTMGFGEDPTLSSNPESFLANFALVHSMHVLDYLSWNYPSWSISVEFWAYVLFFALVSFSGRFLPLTLAICAVGSGILLVWLGLALDTRHGMLFTYDYGFLRCVLSFCTGALICHFHRHFTLAVGPAFLSAVEVALCALCILLVSYAHGNVAVQAITIATFAVTLFWFANSTGVVTRLMSLQAFRFIGLISYSIYMTHAIIVAGVDNVFRYIVKLPTAQIEGLTGRPPLETEWAALLNIGTVAIVIGVSALTYRYIEVPGKALGRPRKRRATP